MTQSESACVAKAHEGGGWRRAIVEDWVMRGWRVISVWYRWARLIRFRGGILCLTLRDENNITLVRCAQDLNSVSA